MPAADQAAVPASPLADQTIIDAEVVAPPGDAVQRVLIVDDNADMRAYLQRLLQRRWHVHAARNGREALDAVAAVRPDVIISDVMMPHVDGFQLLAALRANPETRDIAFILLSARAGEEARVDGLAAGADEYLTKPFSGRELMARVDSLLMRRRIRIIADGFAQRMQSVFAQAPVAIAILNGPTHVFEQANALYQRLIGRREILGRPIRDALPELEGQGIYELLDHVYRSGQPYLGHSERVELRRGPEGELEECFFNFVYQPLIGTDGVTEGIAVVSFEVTELAKAKRAAETANRVKDEFLAMLGHELRNPLAPIITALQLMRLRGITVAEKERAIIERQAKHLVALVDDLLDVSRVAQGKVQLRKKQVEAAEVIAKAIETASPILEEKLHRLTIEVPASGLPLEADPERLGQVIANLLTNAAKYTGRGGEVRVHASRQADSVVIMVSDNGIGIADHMLPHIFDLFVQEAQALSRSQGGLGLGLAIAKSMTTLHGGTIRAESDGVGRGSRFSVTLPIVAAPMPALSAGALSNMAALPLLRDDSLSILIVDDNVDAARMLGETLALSGHRTRLAFDGPSALEIAEEFTPDVGLLDIGLPGMDGYELAARLRERAGGRSLRLFAITGYGQETDRQRSLEAGFDKHLVKPIDPKLLESLLGA